LGHRVREATNGLEAAEAIAAETPDVLIMDLSMPKMDGRTLLRSLKERNVGFPIIVLTADVQQLVVAECLALGAAEVLHKPPREEKIAAALERVLAEAPGRAAVR
jgi:CheY-like chemotaxis protein